MTNIQIDSTHVKNSDPSLNDQVPPWTFYPMDSSAESSTETTTANPTNDSLNTILDTYNFTNWNTSCPNWENMLDTFIPTTANHHHHHSTMNQHKTIIKNSSSCSTSSSSSSSSSSTSDHCMSLPPTPPLQSPTNPVFSIDFFNTTTTTPYVYTTPYKEVSPPPSSNHQHPPLPLNSTIIKLEEMNIHPLIHPPQSIDQSSSTSSSSSNNNHNNHNNNNHFHQFKTISNLDHNNNNNNNSNTNNNSHYHHNNTNRRRASEHSQSTNTNHRQPRRRSTHPSVASVVSLTAHEPVSSIIDGIEHITFLYSHDRLVKEYTIRTDVDHVEVDVIPLTFRNQNTIYPRANVEKEEYTGNRWNYESTCNMLGWKLCWLNQQQLCGRRGLIQRAVDSYRNRHVEMRSRRVTRQEKVANGTLRKRRSKKSLS
ncbi:unnamed protein product [Cunninghamella blakesleeana]